MPAWDLAVVGGGPAGATLAALVKKYDPKRRVLLLEKAPGPRHHIGESLQPGGNPVLRELGVFDQVVKAGFPRKIGAVYVWGKDRRPWENLFTDANDQTLFDREGVLSETVGSSFQVRRSEYDEILLRNAEALGVTVVRGAHATGILEKDGAVVGLTYRDASGKPARAEASLTADCSGQNAFLSKYRKIREFNPALKNVAAYAYWRGARWKFRYSGRRDETKIFVCSVPCGWFWYIPIAQDVISVGLVTRAEFLKASGKEARALYFQELRKCAEIWPLLQGAEQIKDFDGTGEDFFTHSDWSYMNVAASGPGWLAAGDAAVFVDPILSSGVLLAHLCAQRAAYTALTHWQEPDAAARRALWRDYDGFCQEFSARFMAMALFWYGNDRNARRWWRQAAEIQRAHLPVGLSDRTAFITVSTGLSQYYDRLHSANLLEEVHTKPRDETFYLSVLKGDPNEDPARGAPPERWTPRLLHPFRVEPAYLPVYGTGTMLPARRARFIKTESADPVADVFNPRRIVSGPQLELLGLIDGKAAWPELRAKAAARGVPEGWLSGQALVFLRELGLQGVVDLGAGRAKGRATRAKGRSAPRASARRA